MYTISERDTVPGEIVPVSAAQSRTWYRYVAGYAIDRNMTTRSLAGPGSDDITWLKVQLGEVHCVNRVVRYYSSNTQYYYSWSCSQEECTCEGWYCYRYLVSVYTESSTSPTSTVAGSPTSCRLGDTVKLYSEYGSSIYAHELVITGKLGLLI